MRRLSLTGAAFLLPGQHVAFLSEKPYPLD